MMFKLADHRFLAALTVAAVVATVGSLASRAQSPTRTTICGAPAEMTRFDRPLSRFSRLLAQDKPITVSAYGSSSTAGAGASSTAMNYPSRLEAELKERFPRHSFKVINRGVNGTETKDMLASMDETLLLDKPDLVVWQVGTNSVLRDRSLTDAGERIGLGISKIRKAGADVVLLNPQYAPRVTVKAELDHMLKIIANTASLSNVNMFDRFAVMRYWRVSQNMPFTDFLSIDELHMNDWSYGCVAKLLSNSIREAATRPAQTATSAPAAPPR